MNLEKVRTTRLETAVENGDCISTILDNKVEEYRSTNMPVEKMMADYIFRGVENQDAIIKQYENYLENLKEEISKLKELQSDTKVKISEWMDKNGLEKLSGINCSSITVKKASTSITNKIKRDISDTELLEKGFAHYEETIKDIPASIKINRKRG